MRKILKANSKCKSYYLIKNKMSKTTATVSVLWMRLKQLRLVNTMDGNIFANFTYNAVKFLLGGFILVIYVNYIGPSLSGGSQYVGLGTGGGIGKNVFFFLFFCLGPCEHTPPRRFELES